MTGFAGAEALSPPFRLAWELRSVNHRFLDIAIRLPEELRALEGACRDILAEHVRRGKVDCTLKIAAVDDASAGADADAAVLSGLSALEGRIRHAFPEARPLSVLEVLRWPGVLKERQLDYAALAEPAKRALREAAAALEATRAREGERLASLLEERLDAIAAWLEGVRPAVAGAQ